MGTNVNERAVLFFWGFVLLVTLAVGGGLLVGRSVIASGDAAGVQAENAKIESMVSVAQLRLKELDDSVKKEKLRLDEDRTSLSFLQNEASDLQQRIGDTQISADELQTEISLLEKTESDLQEELERQRELERQKADPPAPSSGTCWSAVFRVSAYSSTPDQTWGDPFITASGTRVSWGTIAVDTYLIPFGSRLYIPGYGWGTAEDRGGAIKGYRLDVWMPSRDQALQWGIRHLEVTVC